MEPEKTIPEHVAAYIATFPEATQVLLEQLRATIQAAAPDAVECISYRMPAYRLQGILVYFAAYRHHIGFYPGASGIAAFKAELSVYRHAKGSVQFPLDAALPLGLVTKIVCFRVAENEQKVKAKRRR